MHIEDGKSELNDAPVDAGDSTRGRPRLSRRQALGRMSAVATAGAAAWVVPEILAARPAAAAMSSPGGGKGGGDPDNDGDHDGNGGPDPDRGHGPMSAPVDGKGSETLATISPSSMFSPTRHGIVRDAELGGAMVAGGWVFHRWMSRGAASTAAPVPRQGSGADVDPV